MRNRKAAIYLAAGMILCAGAAMLIWTATHQVPQSSTRASSPTTAPESTPSTRNSSSDKADANQQAILEAKSRVPVIEWQIERVDAIHKESIDHVLENMANFDDFMFASTASGTPFSKDSPQSIGTMLPRLFRVRRLLEDAQVHPALVSAKAREVLSKALEQWPKVYKEELARRDKAVGEHPSMIEYEPSEHEKVRMRAEVATYLLAEIPDHAAFPILMDSYRKQQEWIDAIPVEKYRWTAQCPVPPPTTLYAMHRLISTYPKAKLSSPAAAAREAYMAWATAHVPEPVTFQGVRSTSKYDESDP